MSKKKKSDKSLGRDPFEDMEEIGWGEEDELPPRPDQEETGPVLSEVEGPVLGEAEGPVPSEAEGPVLSEAEGPVLSEAEGPVPSEAEGPVLSEAEAEVEAPTEEVESEPDETEAEGQLEAEPAEEDSHLLDELMATIDKEVEEAFGPGAMTDLATIESTDQEKGEEQFVIFSLAGSEYAVPAVNVREIGEPPTVTPVPNVPDWVLGVANLRGDVLSLVDLRAFLGMERIDYDEDTRVMVVHSQQDASIITTGLIVDLVSDIRYLSVEQIGAPAASIEDQIAPYLRGVYEHDGRLLVVLNLGQLLFSSEMRQFEPI